MEYRQAIKIVKLKLNKLGYKFEKDKHNLTEEHFRIDLRTIGWSNCDYRTGTIKISTRYYDKNYKNSYRRITNFNVINGDYIKLKTKIDTIIQISKNNKNEVEAKKEYEKNKIEKWFKIIKPYNPIKEFSDNFIIDTTLVKIEVSPNSNYDSITLNYKGNIKQLPQLIETLRRLKCQN